MGKTLEIPAGFVLEDESGIPEGFTLEETPTPGIPEGFVLETDSDIPEGFQLESEQDQILRELDSIQKETQAKEEALRKEDKVPSDQFKRITPKPVTIEEQAVYNYKIDAKKILEESRKNNLSFGRKIGEIAASGAAGVFQGTLAASESLFRIPQALNRGLGLLDKITGGNLPVNLRQLKDATEEGGII